MSRRYPKRVNARAQIFSCRDAGRNAGTVRVGRKLRKQLAHATVDTHRRKAPHGGAFKVLETLPPKEASAFIVAQKRDLQMTIHRLIATKVTDHPITTGAVGNFSVMDAEPNSIRTPGGRPLNESEAHVGRIYGRGARSLRSGYPEAMSWRKARAGRIYVLCVKGHFAALSEPCKDLIGHAAERKVRAH